MTTPREDYCTIPLTKDQVALVDAGDFETVSKHKWCAQWNPSTRSYYAIRSFTLKGKRERVYLHRMLLGLKFGDTRQGDHNNRNTLDNRRLNLRIGSRSDNQHNRSLQRNNKSGFKGVHWNKTSQKWKAQIALHGKIRQLGLFSTPEAAHAAYCQAAILRHGEFARFG